MYFITLKKRIKSNHYNNVQKINSTSLKPYRVVFALFVFYIYAVKKHKKNLLNNFLILLLSLQILLLISSLSDNSLWIIRLSFFRTFYIFLIYVHNFLMLYSSVIVKYIVSSAENSLLQLYTASKIF